MLMDRQTDTQTYSSQYFATDPTGEVMIECVKLTRDTTYLLQNMWDLFISKSLDVL